MTALLEAHRTPPLTIAVAAALTATWVLGLVTMASAAPASPEPPTDTATGTATSGTPYQQPAAEASDGGGLVIVEKGHTFTEDLAGDPQLSWGVIVENTSTTMAGAATLRFEVTDTSGDSLTEETDWDSALGMTLIAPGARVGFGSTSYIDDGEPGDVAFHLDDPLWWHADATPSPLGELTVSELEADWIDKGETENYWSSDGISFPVNERGDLLLAFRIDSTHPRILDDTSGTAVFRDTTGAIIGASRPSDFADDIPPGWSNRTLRVKYAPPEGLDEETIEVYLYPGAVL